MIAFYTENQIPAIIAEAERLSKKRREQSAIWEAKQKCQAEKKRFFQANLKPGMQASCPDSFFVQPCLIVEVKPPLALYQRQTENGPILQWITIEKLNPLPDRECN